MTEVTIVAKLFIPQWLSTHIVHIHGQGEKGNGADTKSCNSHASIASIDGCADSGGGVGQRSVRVGVLLFLWGEQGRYVLTYLPWPGMVGLGGPLRLE